MRHRLKGRKLGRTKSHRDATLNALATALFKHKKIKTTVAKAKETRTFVEPMITRAKTGTVHARRIIARHLNDNSVIQELFGDIVEKIGDRPGGYTRVIKLGQRQGDAAEMAILELVDYNEVAPTSKPKKKTTAKTDAPKAKTKKEPKVQDAEVIEEVVEKEEKPKAPKEEAKAETKTESVPEVEPVKDEVVKEEKPETKPSDDAEEPKKESK
ncbi:MAG: 50S ribosomal protein L17 [Melioribacteraceae bacterium]|nr:50S ribosomal protein L17 [Melioribacteraceae bacterium]MCF8264610.1 50S ribosomal protein L17 [Melioribacteraceae bacterium]MCF8414457.1 50S ribosomal protein L17 [Melioribacteraceae bacterium]